MFKVGDKVWLHSHSTRNAIILECKHPQYTCEFEYYRKGERGVEDGWYKGTRTFMCFELRGNPFSTDKKIHVKNKWGKRGAEN